MHTKQFFKLSAFTRRCAKRFFLTLTFFSALFSSNVSRYASSSDLNSRVDYRDIYKLQYNKLANDLAQEISVSEKRKVFAVLKFETQGISNEREVGVIVAEELTTALSRKQFNLVERAKLKALYSEKELAQKGVTSSKRALIRAKAIGAEALVFGTIHQFEKGKFKIRVKVVDVNSHQILATSELYGGRTFLNYNDVIGYHKHDGIFLSLHTGWAEQTTIGENLNTLGDITLKHQASTTWIKIGGKNSSNFLLHFDLGFTTMNAPTITAQNNILSQNRLKDTSIQIVNAGIGGTYYFMPSNIFLTASIHDASAIYKNIDDQIDLNYGIGLMLAVGKEWWMSKNWAIGILVGYAYSRILFEDIQLNISTSQGTVSDSNFLIQNHIIFMGITATYN